MRGLRSATSRGLVVVPLLAAIGIVLGPQLDIPTQLKWVLWLSFGIAALSLDFVWGNAGIFSFGQNALFGLGAYAYAVVGINVFPYTHETLSALGAAGLVAAALAVP